MELSQSLFSVSQNFFSPDIVQKFSSEIQQPVEQTKAGLKSIIPTILMGIVNKGSTKEGAENLINLASKQNPDPTISADKINTSQGSEVVNGIFGSNTSTVVEKLGSSTGLNPSSITKMLGMAAPMIMGVLGSKIKNEKLNASGLMSFLEQQKSSLAGLIPGGLSSLSGFGSIQKQFTQQRSWGKIIGALALLVILALWWFSAHKTQVGLMSPPPAIVTQVTTQTATPTLSGLNMFLNSTTIGDMSRRFHFEHLSFASGTTTLMSGAEAELNQIVSAMKEHPASTARIEGFTDNVGVPSTNQALSMNRALEVKQQLVKRGIESNRIAAVGLGAASPIASNTTAEGRAQNRRIEFIVTKH